MNGYRTFKECFQDKTGGNVKIKKSEYLNEGLFPVIDQGKEFIGGYTNDRNKLVRVSPPCIVYGDHSRTIKYLDREFALGADGVKVLATADFLSPKYAYYYLTTVRLPEAGYDRSFKYLKRIEIPVFDLETQNKIVAILDKANALVQKRQQTIDLLDELLRAQFFEMFGDFNKFDRVPFKSVLSKPLRNGISPSSNGKIEFDVLVLSAITGGRFDNTKIKKGVFKQLPDDSKIVNSSDFLVCRGNGNLNMVGVGEFAEDINHAVFPDTMIGAKIDTEKIRKLFLSILWKTQFIRNQIKKASRTTNGTHKINQTGLENIELIMPPIDLQNKFEKIAESINRLLNTDNSLTESKNDLDNFLSSLIQNAFSSKLKLDISVELDALLEKIDLQKPENDLFSIITNEEYLLSMVSRLNNQEFENQELYDKAKHVAFQLLKEEDRLAQAYNEQTKSLKLVVK